MSNGKYSSTSSAGALIRALERSRERAAAAVGGASGLVIVDDDEPSDPETGQLWYDTDDTC